MLGGSVNIKHLYDAALLDSIDVSVRPIAMVYCYGFSTGFNLSESDEVCHETPVLNKNTAKTKTRKPKRGHLIFFINNDT